MPFIYTVSKIAYAVDVLKLKTPIKVSRLSNKGECQDHKVVKKVKGECQGQKVIKLYDDQTLSDEIWSKINGKVAGYDIFLLFRPVDRRKHGWVELYTTRIL
jgi:hypothetical protein